MDDHGGPDGPRRGRGGNGRRPWRHRPHSEDGAGRGAGQAARGARGHNAPRGGGGGGTRGRQKRGSSGPGHSSERPVYLSTATPEQEIMLQQIFKNNPGPNDQAQHNSKRQTRPNQNPNRNDRRHTNRDRPMGFKLLEEISKSDSTEIIEKINQHKKYFTQLLDTPVDNKKYDVFALVLELVTNVWKSSFEESKKLLLLDLCNTKFIDHLQLYLLQLPYTVSRDDKFFNKYYWSREKEFWGHFMGFCECIINVSPSTAVMKCGALIEAVSKSCLDGLKERQGFELPEEYTTRMTKIRDSLKVCDEAQTPTQRRIGIDEVGEPQESFRELSVLPTGSELLERRPFLRPNVVEGAYSDVEHYLDVQFRLLREDCFGPLREGIHQYIKEPMNKKYDNIRVYRNVKFLEPFVSKQKIGSMVLLDESTMKMFKKVNWAHSKRFLFGSLVLFTKDNCTSFLVGTILERDEKYLSKRQIPVDIVNAAIGSNLYTDEPYVMIECEVYFEPYYHVLKALQDPSFPEHLVMSKYIVNVEKVPEKPAYLTRNTIYEFERKDTEEKVPFIVLADQTWPSKAELGLNSTQYEAYKLAVTHEFAVIQGPPGTGKTFIGVKVAETLLKNAPIPQNTCCMLVICYTNHALDQFLEALLPITSSLARIGGRSRNEKLQQLNINNLRRKDNSSYFHERRIELKRQITALEYAQGRLDALGSGVLSFKSILAYNDECNILERFYRGSGVKDALKHWLFENVDNVEINPALLEQQVENEHPGEQEYEVDADDDIFARDDLVLDDLDDDDILGDRSGFDSVTTSFLLSDKEEKIQSLLRSYQNLQIKDRPRHELIELENEIRLQYSEIKLFKDMMEHRNRPPRIRLVHGLDLSTIPRIERWSLYFKWANAVMADVKRTIKSIEEKLKSTAEAYEEARMMVDLSVLKKTKVIGMTTSGAARLRKLLAEIAPPIVVVEEAAEVLESHIVTSLTKSCQHLILIGDHQQLRPSAACVRLARHYGLEVSLFERMIRNGVHSRRLGVQHRMRPEIAALVAPHIYPDLRNHRSVEDFPPVRGVAHNLFFFSHDYREQSVDDSSSRTNTQEADLVLRLANYLMQQGYKSEEVTILAAYSGQLFYMRKQRPLYAYLTNVKITVLDNYQGEESKIILLSLVRNNTNDNIGFLGTENRICVALSRAREGFFIFGNIELLKRKSTLWTNIAKTLEDNGSLGTSLRLQCENHKGKITTITKLKDFDKAPEGGCLLECKYHLPCGHPCPRVCHAYDLAHATIQCTRDCERRICKVEGHKCPFPCAKVCEPCKRLVDKSLPCGHTKAVPCFKEAGDPSIRCMTPVPVTLPDCGHKAVKECYMKTADVICREKCPDRLSCGHACRRTCHVLDDPEHERKIGSMVLLDESTMKMFKKVNWAHSKRFLFGSLVLFTKDNCTSFLVGTILERDEKYLSKRQIPVDIVNAAIGSNLYTDEPYVMIECEVYFEPYYHVLKALQDPSFPEHLVMSKYIVNVEKVPEKPAYLTRNTIYEFERKDTEEKVPFIVLADQTWPSKAELGLNSTQYEAYKLAVTHEFAVIQGPPGTGKTFIGVKVAETLLKNAPIPQNTCCMLVICYTNHALDQFLEALLPITSSLARIGGRSRNEKLQQLNINNLRRKDNSSYFHERRIELKRQITALEYAQGRLDALGSGVLSFKSILAYNDECNILERFYRGSGVKDALKHWLFENVDNVEINPALLEQQVENEHPGEQEYEVDADDDIFARDDLVLDDLDDDDILGDRSGFDSVTTSFLLSDKEEKIQSLLRSYQNLQIKDRPRHELIELENEIRLQYSEIKLFKDMMEHRNRPPRIRLVHGLDLSTIPRIERWSLYFKWANAVMADVKRTIKSIEEKLKSTAEAYEEARMMVDLSVLKKTKVIGMTTSGAARLRKLLAEIAPPIVVVEEAAEVLESHIVTSLTKSCQHLILIGDHQQLRPSAACVRLARHYGLEVSLFERMIRNGVHSRRLGVQHRMRPEIAALVAPHIYPDLRNHRSVEDFPPVRGVAHNLFFFSHDYREQSVDDSSSRTNTQEADLVLRLANYLMQQGYKSEEVTILAAYSGQLFYMRKQRPLYAYLTNVKITVLDNYQGEESKIILLSLVRNNTNDNIGFLGTENRICVALSRAREGFFIFGNIELLKRKSTLWTNIAKTLEDNGSLGTSLRLQCENHKGKITTITKLKDFDKAPEGGCLLECKYHLPCGHPCPRVCHAYDLAHATIQCTRDCERRICKVEGHKCPFPCAKVCEPCKRLVDKSLPCGHTKAVPCFKEAGDPSIRCMTPVPVTLPDCGHKAVKECYMKTADVICREKCPDRLSCGHACRRTCHVLDDPEHERYTCLKPCPKTKKGCTADPEAADIGEHKCLRSCFEECVECNVQVIKKRSACKHSTRVACHEDVNATKCREKCARSLPCEHFCKKLCFEKCGDCKQKVKKTIPGCNHEIQIECGIAPTREHCKMKCERTMGCGHVCKAPCSEPCNTAKCTEITQRSFASPCGHRVQLPCNVAASAVLTGVTTMTLLSACAAPCGALLRCGHSCGGSCAGCRQGRLHQPCTAQCHQLNICGHRCEEPCNQVCPPCRRRCEVKCPHSGCGKLCGAPCTPCTEAECGRACSHSACTRACGAPCDRAPCERACPRALPCGHRCRGLCGEPCPPVCRTCDPDGFPTDLLGDPYGDDDKLIQLQDCPHILDVDNLDNLMKGESETVQIKTCPFCRTPIINTYRYKDLVNRLLKDQINPIKEKVYGTDAQRREKKNEMNDKVLALHATHARTVAANKDWSKAFFVIQKVIRRAQSDKRISLLQLEMNDIYLNFLETVGEYYMKYKDANLNQLETEMKSHVKFICDVLIISTHKISQQQQLDINNELKRMNSMIQLAKILSHEIYRSSKSNSNVIQASSDATDAILSWRVFEEDKAVECLKKLENVVKLSGIASKEERDMVVRAIGLKAGHWYKCPNGHYYCIGECGGAMQLSRCPECGATIGGQNHALTAGNRHASEMDGSQFAAWSEEANNMANFRFD